MGAVYKARQPALDRLVVLKILPAQAAPDPGFAERFTREARALARLTHPNIVGVHEFGQVNASSAGVPPATGVWQKLLTIL
jgi:serine/threonine protein kinase